jgi:PST family polysaccharide transporter
MGLMALYGSVLSLAQGVANAGISRSGVRQIAESARSGQFDRIAQTTTVIRRTSALLGLLGAVLLVAFSNQVSVLTFGDNRHALAVSALSIAVFLGSVSGAQAALIQGMRRISDLAMMGIWGTFFGVIITVSLIYFFRENGIVPSIVGVAAITLVTSWWYSRKLQIRDQSLTILEWKQEASTLLKLGLAFNVSALLTLGAAYAIRLIILHKISFEAAGLYQSAWTLGGLYVGFILQSMTTDFFPRLTAVAENNAECNRLVNEQAQISLLLAGPGLVATMAFAPLVIALFYTSRFAEAVEPLRWICFGMALRVVAWPMGLIVLAKGVQTIFVWTEVAATVVHVGLAFVLVGYFGLVGATVAFFGLYVWHGILIYWIVRQLSGFRWSAANRQLGLLFLPLIGLVFGAFHWLPFWIATSIGAVATLVAGIYSVRMLVSLVSLDRVPGPIRRLLTLFRFVPVSADLDR